jgi:hypothetical protein
MYCCSPTLTLREELDGEEIPNDAKLFFPILKTRAGPSTAPANPKLKLILTSAGLMPNSTADLKGAYEQLRKSTPGRGVLYLMDAKLKSLQWADHAGNPAKDSKSALVSYQRVPDEPGGKPALDSNGKALPKAQVDLAKIGPGYHSVEWGLKRRAHYSNGHLDIVAKSAPGEEVPVFLSYMSYESAGIRRQPAQGDNTAPPYAILLARGFYKDGELTLLRADGTGPMTDADYEITPVNYSAAGNAAFRPVGAEEFKAVLDSVDTLFSTGGVTWIPVMHF